MRRLAMVAMLGMGWALAACGSSPTHTPPSASSASPSTSVTVGGPCASVKTTTAIVDVPPACAALWAPYQVTKVPPPDILQQEHVPLAPPVKNMTNGAVSDADAQLWANASNRDSGWYKWGEANGQIAFLRHLVGPALISPQDVAAMQQGAVVLQPDCNLYPTTNVLFAVDSDGRSYFSRKNLPTGDRFVFVVSYTQPPCSETIRYPDGHATSLSAYTQPNTVFAPGVLRSDPVLGDLWFADAGGNCQDSAGPPPAWCGR
jgi:hypothetical protein